MTVSITKDESVAKYFGLRKGTSIPNFSTNLAILRSSVETKILSINLEASAASIDH